MLSMTRKEAWKKLGTDVWKCGKELQRGARIPRRSQEERKEACQATAAPSVSVQNERDRIRPEAIWRVKWTALTLRLTVS